MTYLRNEVVAEVTVPLVHLVNLAVRQGDGRQHKTGGIGRVENYFIRRERGLLSALRRQPEGIRGTVAEMTQSIAKLR